MLSRDRDVEAAFILAATILSPARQLLILIDSSTALPVITRVLISDCSSGKIDMYVYKRETEKYRAIIIKLKALSRFTRVNLSPR